MSLLIQYLIKLSIGLALVWLFYQLVLRRLTFYNSNRWYLLGCTVLSFLIPFINIAPVLNNDEGTTNGVARFIPTVQQYIVLEQAPGCPVPIWSSGYDKWDWIAFGLIAGGGFFLLRFIIRCISFFRMRRKAKLVSNGEIKLYQVDKDIIPFSFGNSIFINRQLHEDSELQEIIRHEFVHVKQKHTHDIIWGELLCILNWYNPFGWLIRKAIRQNLEFIADNKVLENGFDKKQYQYLLLKVIGNRHFSIANQFNFSSLKKRIAMMNKMKSARSHLFKFFFVLPLVVVLLFAFRSNKQRQEKNQQEDSRQKARSLVAPNYTIDKKGNASPVVDAITDRFGYSEFHIRQAIKDTVPDEFLNAKGYYVEIIDNKGNCTVVVWNKNKKEIDRMPLTKWNEKESHYENLYGDIWLPPAPPEPPTPPTPIAPPPAGSAAPSPSYKLSAPKAIAEPKGLAAPTAVSTPIPPIPPMVHKMPDHVTSISITNNKAVIILKTGEKEEYNLDNATEKAAFDKKYPKVRLAAPPTPKVGPGTGAPHSVITPVSTTVDVSVEPVVSALNPISVSVEAKTSIETKTSAPVVKKIQ